MMELKGKKVLVVGLGKSGLAAALFLRQTLAQDWSSGAAMTALAARADCLMNLRRDNAVFIIVFLSRSGCALFLRFSDRHRHCFPGIFDNRIGALRFIAAYAVVFIHEHHAESPLLQHSRKLSIARADGQRPA